MFCQTGKAPPNLPPGVPPLLPNPYIMAPGLLHAYPVSLTLLSEMFIFVVYLILEHLFNFLSLSTQPQVYGYDDLQMLQTRFSMVSYVYRRITERRENISTRPKSLLHGLCLFLFPGLLQHSVCNSYDSTDRQRGESDQQPIFW